MKKKAIIGKDKLSDLKLEVLGSKLTYDKIARESGVSTRSVSYFFSGRHYNATIHKVTVRLLQKELVKKLSEINLELEKLSELI